jgi:hypothetical protein
VRGTGFGPSLALCAGVGVGVAVGCYLVTAGAWGVVLVLGAAWVACSVVLGLLVGWVCRDL